MALQLTKRKATRADFERRALQLPVVPDGVLPGRVDVDLGLAVLLAVVAVAPGTWTALRAL